MQRSAVASSGPPSSLLAVGCTAAFGLVGAWLAAQPTTRRDDVLATLSTNLVNLAQHPVLALVGSAFVTTDSVRDWLALGLIGLASAGQALGSARLAGLVVATHVLGTLVSESVLDLQIRAGLVPASDRLILDVGPSYVVAPALVVGVLLGSTLGRVLSGLAFALLWPHLFVGLTRLELTAVGHATAITVAVLSARALRRDRRRTTALVDPLGHASSGPPRHLRSRAWFSRSP